MKNLWSLFVVFVIALLTLPSAVAVQGKLDVTSIKVNGDEVRIGDGRGLDRNNLPAEKLAIEEGQKIKVRVKLEARDNVNDIEVDAKISGFEYSDYDNIYDSTHLFDLQGQTTKYVNLEVQLPKKLDKKHYWLRVRVMNDNQISVDKTVVLAVEPTRHGVDIADVSFSPSTTVKAGRSLLSTVLLENFGDKLENDVKVTVAIPKLGIQATEYVDEVKTRNSNIDREDVPEMFLPIPATAQAGEYEVVVTAKYDFYEDVVKSYKINVVADERFQTSDKVVLAIGPEKQNVAQGNTAIYGLALNNAGKTSKAYTVSAQTGGWADAKVSDGLVVLEPGKSKVVYVELTPAQDATAGDHIASVTIQSGDVEKTVVLSANVVKAEGKDSGASLRSGLEIALVVLVVVLVILGLIVGFSRLRKDEEEEQTYY